MNTQDLKHIIDTAGLTYMLLVVAFLQLYILFTRDSKKDSKSKKSSSTSHKIK